MIGKHLAHYEITALLGKGGMGEVYRARDTRLRRDVAIKILPTEMAADPMRLERFQREAEAVAGLTHPNVVTLHSLERHGEIRFITMELVDGVPLNELIDARTLSLSEVLDIGMAVAGALSAAHEGGIIHRDLKPANVMRSPNGHVTVLDFGLAKLAHEESPSDVDATDVLLTREGTVLGSTPYMSPEQLRGRDVDARTDIFSFGILLYELATGLRPFRGDNSADITSAILGEAPLPITQLRDDLPPALEQIIARCLEKNPELRYPTSAEIGDALRELSRQVESGVYSSPPLSDSTLTVPSQGRRPWQTALAAAILLTAVLVFFLGRGNRAADQSATDTPPAEKAATTALTTDSNSIAVMAFADMSPERDQGYFSDGIADELLNMLARIPDLKVISRTSSFSYKGKDVSVAQVAKELGVAHILEGSVRKAGSQLRITAQLIDAVADTPLWSETYDRELDDIFAIQDDIAADVVAHLKVALLGDAKDIQSALGERPTDDLDAYQAYLLGLNRFHAVGFSRDSFKLGEQMFERAIALDPGFAMAYARLSSISARAYHYGFERTEECLSRARKSAERALELQPGLAEAQLAMAHYFYWGRKDYQRALETLDTALRHAPNMSEALLTVAYIKRRQGDFEASVEAFQKYRELSPLDPNAYVGLGETYGTMRKYEAAQKAFMRALDLAPDDPYPYTELALLYLRSSGNAELARSILTQSVPAQSNESCRVAYLVELMDRRFDAALEKLGMCSDPIIEASAFYTPASILKAYIYRLQNRPDLATTAFDSARAHLEHKLRLDPDDARVHAALGASLAGLGRKDDAIRHGRRAVELSPMKRDALEAPVQIVNLALIYTLLGESEAAVEQLDIALSIPSTMSVDWLRADPRWDELREHPSFIKLLQQHSS